MYHVRFDGCHTARRLLPSPSKSAATGMSFGSPHCFTTAVRVLLKSTNQVPFEGRQTEKSALPSPSKSATTGMSPGSPQCSTIDLLGLLLGMMCHVPSDGRQTA